MLELWGLSTHHRWFPSQRTSNAELLRFLCVSLDKLLSWQSTWRSRDGIVMGSMAICVRRRPHKPSRPVNQSFDENLKVILVLYAYYGCFINFIPSIMKALRVCCGLVMLLLPIHWHWNCLRLPGNNETTLKRWLNELRRFTYAQENKTKQTILCFYELTKITYTELMWDIYTSWYNYIVHFPCSVESCIMRGSNVSKFYPSWFL